MVTLEELVPLGYPQKRTYKTAREPHCRPAKPVAEDKFRTYRGQAGTSRQKEIWRLCIMTHWSERDLAHLPAMQRAAQEREMGNMYETFDEKGLDTALAIMEHEAPAKVAPSGEETPSDPAKREEIVLRTRRRLSMQEAAGHCNSPAIEQLIGMKASQLPEATQSRAGAQLLSTKTQYGWIPHNAGFGFLDLAPSILHSNWF